MAATMRVMESRVEELNKALMRAEAGFTVCYTVVPKGNGVELEAYALKSTMDSASVISPTVYYNPSWFDRPEDEVVKYLKDLYREHSFKDDFSEYITKDYILANVYPALMSGNNLSMLDEQDIYCRSYLDLVLYFRIRVTLPSGQEGSFKATRKLLEQAGVSHNDLYDATIQNAGQSSRIMKMSDLLSDVIGEELLIFEDEFPMIVISNEARCFGAGVICSKSVLKEIVTFCGCSAYLIPSSVHEIIAISATGSIEPADLTSMVGYVNAEHVQPHEVLSNHVYRLDEDLKISII